MKAAFDNFTEPQVDRRKFVIGFAFAAAAALAAWRSPRMKLDRLGSQKLDDLVPKKIGRWNLVSDDGVVVPPNDPLLYSLYSQQLTRVYWDGQNTPIMVLMAQNGFQSGFLQVHRPEYCYTAVGYDISNTVPHPIQLASGSLRANEMDATRDGRTEHVVYWTRIGDEIPTSWTQQKLMVAEQNLRGIVPDAILIRISTLSEDRSTSLSSIDTFVREMISSIPADRRSVFIA
jgi:EpsI family protein